jgi:hypothetical protein
LRKAFFNIYLRGRSMHFNYFRTIGSLMIISLLACGGSFKNTYQGKMTTSQLVNKEGNSTVALVYYDARNTDEEISDIKVYCTGIWVDQKHILTANHCVKAVQEKLQKIEDDKASSQCSVEDMLAGNCSDAPVHKVIGEEGLAIHFVQWREAGEPGAEPTAWHLSEVVKYNEAHDLALLEAVGRAVPAHESAELALSVPGMGEPVQVVGHTKGLYWTFLEGNISGYRGNLPHVIKDREGPVLQIQVPAYYGNSGGGAFDADGKLVGMADFMLESVPTCVFFIPVDPIRAFLK